MKYRSLSVKTNLLIKKFFQYFTLSGTGVGQSLKKNKLITNVREQRKTLLSYSLLLLLISLMGGCQNNVSQSAAEEENLQNIGRENTELTLNNAVLEQSNSEGNLVWKIKAKRTTYSDDRKIAYLEDITANLLQDKKIILKVKSQQGEVLQQGNIILLRDDVVVTDARNQSVLRGNLVEWRPLQNVLTITDNLQINDPSLIVTADTAQYFTDTESLALTGQIIANTSEPSLLLKSDRLLWQIPQQKVIANNPLTIIRYQEDNITDRLLADKAEANLALKTITLNNNVELTSVIPDLKVATNSATWNYQQRFISSEKPIQIVDKTQQITVTGNKGQIDFQSEVAILSNGVKGINNREQTTIYSSQAVWNMTQQEVVATGNVVYNQTQPKLDLTGDKGVFQLEENRAIVTSNQPKTKPVVSVFGN